MLMYSWPHMLVLQFDTGMIECIASFPNNQYKNIPMKKYEI